jgi:hypothetical protein
MASVNRGSNPREDANIQNAGLRVYSKEWGREGWDDGLILRVIRTERLRLGGNWKTIGSDRSQSPLQHSTLGKLVQLTEFVAWHDIRIGYSWTSRLTALV